MDELQQVELTIEAAKEKIARYDRLIRLLKNRDFKALILDGYFKDRAANLAQEIACAPNEEIQADMHKQIEAIGYFHRYLRQVEQEGQASAHALAADEETRAEILAEQLDG